MLFVFFRRGRLDALPSFERTVFLRGGSGSCTILMYLLNRRISLGAINLAFHDMILGALELQGLLYLDLVCDSDGGVQSSKARELAQASSGT